MKNFSRTAAAIALATVFASTAALAQSNTQKPSFTGFGLGGNLSFVKNTLDVSSAAFDFANNSTDAALTANYGLAMGKDWVGTFGLSLGLMNSDYGKFVSGAVTSTGTAKQHIAVSFAPGYRIGRDGLVYAKLALHQMTVNYTSTSGFDLTKTHQGTGFGIGYAHALSPSLEISAEYEAVQFDTQSTSATTTAQPKQGNLNLGIVYRF
jgi:opacity protein-like surface antigen